MEWVRISKEEAILGSFGSISPTLTITNNSIYYYSYISRVYMTDYIDIKQFGMIKDNNTVFRLRGGGGNTQGITYLKVEIQYIGKTEILYTENVRGFDGTNRIPVTELIIENGNISDFQKMTITSVDSYDGYDWYGFQFEALIERFPEFNIKIDGALKTSENGWVKVDGVLREIDSIWTKVDGVLKEV